MPCNCCNLAAEHLMWQQRSLRTRLEGEDSTSLKPSSWMLMTIAEMKMWKTRHQVKMMKAQMKSGQNRNPNKNDFDHFETTTWRDTVNSAVALCRCLSSTM